MNEYNRFNPITLTFSDMSNPQTYLTLKLKSHMS